MGTMGVLSRENSMCKGPVVRGSTARRRIRQSSVAGVQREGVVRTEAEMGWGSSRAPVEEITSETGHCTQGKKCLMGVHRVGGQG